MFDKTKELTSYEKELHKFRSEHVGKYVVILGSYKSEEGENFFKRVIIALQELEIPFVIIGKLEGIDFETL